MSGVNKVIILGRLGQDPEMRYMPDGKAVANLSIATSESWKDKQSGEKVENTEWHKAVCFGPRAEAMGKYLQKGSQVYVEGKLKTDKWQDKETGATRYSTSINVQNFEFVGATSEAQPAQKPAPAPVPVGATDDLNDDIPF